MGAVLAPSPVAGSMFIAGSGLPQAPQGTALEDPGAAGGRGLGTQEPRPRAVGRKGRIRDPPREAPAAPSSEHHSPAGGFLCFDSEAMLLPD